MAIGDVMLTVVYILTLFYTIFWLLTLLDLKDAPRSSMRRLPKVSVVMPAFNEERYLKKSVKSVLQLDYPKEKLEIIIVDDGSTDNTSAIANKIIKANRNRLISLVRTSNQGNGQRSTRACSELMESSSLVLIQIPLLKRMHLKKFFSTLTIKKQPLCCLCLRLKIRNRSFSACSGMSIS